MSQRIPMPMPLGWFQVAYSHELAAAASMPLRYFDTDLVLFRTESGELFILVGLELLVLQLCNGVFACFEI